MDDTSVLIKQKMREMIQAKSPQQRLKMGCSMFDFSRQLVTSAILRENPDLKPSQLRAEIFLRFYGDEFSQGEKEKIIGHFKSCP